MDINEYVVRGNTVLDNRAIEAAVYPFLGPQRSLGDIEGARDALQAAYQEKGYQSVYVELPEQQVSGGVVYLQVTETTVGRVRVVGAKHYSPVELREEVPALEEGKVPDFAQVQRELAQVNRTPGRQVLPMVREGQRPGTMDVDLQVEDKNPWHASIGLNNDYSADTRHLRSVVSLGYDNLWQLGHAISLTYFTAPQDQDNAKVWSGSYTAPLSQRWSVQLSGYQSDSDVATVGSMNVVGQGHSYGVAAIYSLPVTGLWSHSFSFGVDFKDFEEQTRIGGNNDRVPIKYAPLTLGYNGFRYTERSQLALGLSLVAGTGSLLGYGDDDEEFDRKRYRAKSGFGVLKGDLNHTLTFGGDWQVATKAAFQARLRAADLQRTVRCRRCHQRAWLPGGGEHRRRRLPALPGMAYAVPRTLPRQARRQLCQRLALLRVRRGRATAPAGCAARAGRRLQPGQRRHRHPRATRRLAVRQPRLGLPAAGRDEHRQTRLAPAFQRAGELLTLTPE